MKQISSDQIIDNGIPNNTVKSIPRDLADIKLTGKSGLGLINSEDVVNIDSSVPHNSTNPIPVLLPETPQLIGIKSQSVKIKEDGTYAIDVIIEVEDIANISDYEVRISKSAGTI